MLQEDFTMIQLSFNDAFHSFLIQPTSPYFLRYLQPSLFTIKAEKSFLFMAYILNTNYLIFQCTRSNGDIQKRTMAR